MSCLIRAFEQKDVPEILSSWESASKVAHPFLTEEFLDKERHNIPHVYLPNAETWVAEVAGQVVGFVALIGNEVGAIFVRSDFHGKGVGRALMDKASNVRDELELDVFSANEVGRRFYRKYGFTQMAETMHEETGNALLRLKFSPT